ncbi:MAG: lytic transglycosylase domain-containing protein [Pikeienuella sp.]
MYRWITSLLMIVAAAPANASDATVCDRAATVAAHGSDVPVDYLRALTRTETGRARNGKLTPWPWTVNMEGSGHWFETRAQALAFVMKHHARGARSFDIGCFQINYRWHGQAFDSIAAMFDPLANARYAATFLTELRGNKGGWRRAVGRYHSKTPKFAAKYSKRFERILAALAPQTADYSTAAHTLDVLREPEKLPQPSRHMSGEERGMAHLAFLSPPSGGALIALAPRDTPKTPGNGGLVFLREGNSGALLTPAHPLLN